MGTGHRAWRQARMTIMPCGTGITAPRKGMRVMITYADVEKLHVTHSEDPPVLSLYLEAPLDLPAPRPCSGPGRMSGRCWRPCSSIPPTASWWLTAVTPGQGLVPGVASRRCGAVGTTAASCAHAGSAAFAVPDLIEEIAVSTLHDGGQVQAVPDPPGGIAAYLRFPLSRRDGT